MPGKSQHARCVISKSFPEDRIKGKKVVVVGLGISGAWTARWLAGQGAHVTVSDIKAKAEMDPGLVQEMERLGIGMETGGHGEDTFLNAHMIILSPGVPHDTELLREAGEKGIAVLGEMELASRLVETPIIAVTGTNGKSTVTTFLSSVLTHSGLRVFTGGNIGTPLMAFVVEGGPSSSRQTDFLVLEVSSFQLDTTETFSPYVSVILNIAPDHLDRYSDYRAYARSKMKILEHQTRGCCAVLNDDDPELSSLVPTTGASVYRYGFERKKGRHAWVQDKTVRVCLDGETIYDFPLEDYGLPGRHNLENLLAVVLVAMVVRVDPSMIKEAVRVYRGLPHRLERIGERREVAFYDDSKATNVDAASRAVESFSRPLVLIAGGRHKGADYAPLVKVARGRVRRAVLLGEAKELLAEAFQGVVPCSIVENMDQAVYEAFAHAREGDAVLLSPACSSFDMFSSYAERGEAFARSLERLPHGD